MSEKNWKDSNKKLIVLLVCLCLIICGLITGIVVVVIRKGEVVIGSRSEALEYLVNFGNANDIVPYIEATNRALAGATSDDVKADIYIMRANVIYNYDGADKDIYYEQMLSDAYNSEEIKHSGETAYMVYICEEKVGNDEKSKEYYEIAKERGYFDREVRG